MEVGIINYGSGNIGNVTRSLRALNVNYKIINKLSDFKNIDKIILPGQGAFMSAIENLKKSELYNKIIEHNNDEKPILAICLGMQLLFSNSDEFVNCEGLKLLSGEVKKLKVENMPSPIIGWYKISDLNEANNNPVFNKDCLNKYYYFAHSMYCLVGEKNAHFTNVQYNGINIISTVNYNNIYGTQFHPELSNQNGLTIINNFLKL